MRYSILFYNQVVIDVRDVNDNSPVFIQPWKTSFSVLEDVNPGTVITTVKATDPDQGEYGLITYSWRSQEGKLMFEY